MINIPAKGSHPTLGMILKHTTHQHRLQLVDIEKGTQGTKIPRWRSTIKRGMLLRVDETSAANHEDVLKAIIQARNNGQEIIKCEFAITEYQPLHPVEGSLMLYYDQLNAISKHMQGNSNTETTATVNSITDANIKPDKLG
jgi:hypothetical protein